MNEKSKYAVLGQLMREIREQRASCPAREGIDPRTQLAGVPRCMIDIIRGLTTSTHKGEDG